MPPTEVNARDYKHYLNTGSESVPNWLKVNGIKSWSHSPKTAQADTTDADDDGNPTHRVMSRGDEFSYKGQVLLDSSDGSRDEGQEAVESWARALGDDAIKQFMMVDPGGNVQLFDCSAEVTLPGGAEDDPAGWEFKVTVTGGITFTPA